MGVDRKYRTPGPGAYDVRTASRQCLKNAPAIAFGGSLNRADRGKTGPFKVLEEKGFVPGPCSYAVEAEKQARNLCERSHTSLFGKAKRDDLAKLFLGKDAVAYITKTAPGPGTYELGRQRPVFQFPSREPGTTIGGPLANVDRVQTGPLGAAYRSATPGTGAYKDADTFVGRIAPTRGSGRNSCFSATGPTSTSEPGRTNTASFNHRWGIDDEGGGSYCRSSCDEGRSWRGAKANPFSLSPFRFVDSQGQISWQLPILGRKRPTPTPCRRNPPVLEKSRSVPRRATGSRKRNMKSKGSSSSLSAGYSRISSQSPTTPLQGTTFGTGTREQAGQALAPGFKGYAPRSTITNPGPGAYRNVPGSLGLQVDSTMNNSVASSFGKGGRSRTTRDAGVPGPGSYRTVSSLGQQITSTCATAPQPKFGTSVRPALEDGLVG